MANDPDETTPEVVDDSDASELADVDVDPAVAEAEAIAEQVASSRPVRKAASSKKDAPTPKRNDATATAEKEKGTGPIQFVGESVEELKKVNWPTMSQWQQYFVVVLVFVLFIIAYVGLLDVGIGAGLLAIFG